jgi:hypothetical protein
MFWDAHHFLVSLFVGGGRGGRAGGGEHDTCHVLIGYHGKKKKAKKLIKVNIFSRKAFGRRVLLEHEF